jgi:hypothetical protein
LVPEVIQPVLLPEAEPILGPQPILQQGFEPTVGPNQLILQQRSTIPKQSYLSILNQNPQLELQYLQQDRAEIKRHRIVLKRQDLPSTRLYWALRQFGRIYRLTLAAGGIPYDIPIEQLYEDSSRLGRKYEDKGLHCECFEFHFAFFDANHWVIFRFATHRICTF